VQTFEEMLEKLQKRGARSLYLEGTDILLDGRIVGPMPMNHPPMVLAMVRVWGALRDATGLRLGFWMRLSCAFADLLTLWGVYRLVGRAGGGSASCSSRLSRVDPDLRISREHRPHHDRAGRARGVPARKARRPVVGAAFGLGCSIKAWPVLLVPVFLRSRFRGTRRGSD
jgi:hypothetical protein